MSHQPDFLSAYTARSWADIFESDFPIRKVSSRKTTREFEGFYHYTTLSASEKILSSNKESSTLASNKNDFITLYASHFLYLNDGEELLDGLNDIIIEVGRRRIELESRTQAIDPRIVERLKYYEKQFGLIRPDNIIAAPNHFILCFCTRGNLLSQWEWYGKECGVAIEFDLSECVYDGIYALAEGNPNKPYTAQPYQVIYSSIQKQNAINKIKKVAIVSPRDVDNFAMRAIATASFMKHAGFQDEHEMRLMFSPLFHPRETRRDALSRIKYRETNGVIKPFIEVRVKHKEQNKLPIKSVTVGPGHNQLLVFNAMIKMIQSRFAPDEFEVPIVNKHMNIDFCEYATIGGIEVRRSTIPFRG